MTTFSDQLKAFAASPAAFRSALVIDADSGAKRFADVMDPWQATDFAAMDAAWLHVAGYARKPIRQRCYLERPRGHSKTLDLAVMVLWGLAFSGRQLSGVAAAADRTQSRLLRNALDRLVRMNPWLSETIDIQHSTVKNSRTGSELETLSSNAQVSYGRTPDFVCIDELTHWKSEDLWESLISAAEKRSHCVVVAIANAGYTESWQRRIYDAVRTDPDWYFSRLEGPQASWIDPARLEKHRRLLTDLAYRRLWLNEWSSGSGNALQSDDIQRAVTLPGPMGWERGFVYCGGLDLGIKNDHAALAVVGRHVGFTEQKQGEPKPKSSLSSALVDLGLVQPSADSAEVEHITHRGTHRLRLSRLQSWKPPRKGEIDLQAVENAVLDARDAFGLDAVFYDEYECRFMAQRLRRSGLRMIPVAFSGRDAQDTATTLIESFTNAEVICSATKAYSYNCNNSALSKDKRDLELDSPRTKDGHGDKATAFGLAMFGCKRHVRIASVLHRPLLHEGLDPAGFVVDESPRFGSRSELGVTW